MSAYFLAIAVIFPILGGISIIFLPFKDRKYRNIYSEIIVLLTSLLVALLIIHRPEDSVTLFQFTGSLKISLKLDMTGCVFATIVAFLWPLATLYAFEYMEHEHNENVFFGFYVMTFGVTLGIAFAQGILTMYFFYECLTMVTIPLVIHEMTVEAIHATRTYMYYSLGGAAFAFIGMVFILQYGSSANFVAGGVLSTYQFSHNENMLLIVYVLCFCGFAVKAAMAPFSGWLPKAGVAPTPVTALLHAVAVVKAGAFATIRITYFCFGADLLAGTWAQDLLLCMVIFTIVYGCSRALKETHFKRRLAWSTVSNLSYILFGVLLMSPLGLEGALSHMMSHAIMKICAFFCAGAVICKAHKEYIYELDGMGRKMPFVFMVFTMSGLALMGVPGLSGFMSKWCLSKAAVNNSNPLAIAGVAALLISALLTAIYMTSISFRAFFPGKDFDFNSVDAGAKDPSWQMKLPLAVFVVLMVFMGLHPSLMRNMMDLVVASVF